MIPYHDTVSRHRIVPSVGNPSLFPFAVERAGVGTIDGEMEAFYAVLSANFLAGRIDARMHPTGHGSGEIGALDMGKPRESEKDYKKNKKNKKIYRQRDRERKTDRQIQMKCKRGRMQEFHGTACPRHGRVGRFECCRSLR